MRKRQNKHNARSLKRFFFIRYEFWYTGIQSLPFFFKWLWIWNWSKWILLVHVNITTQNFAHHIVILLSIDHSSRFKLKVYIITQHQRETTYDKFIFFARLVKQWISKAWGKFESECQLQIFIYSNSKLKSLVKTRSLNAGTSGLISKRKRLKFRTLH